MTFIPEFFKIGKLVTRRVSPDNRCQHARLSFTCVCGVRIRRDQMTDGEQIECTSCWSIYELHETSMGWRAYELNA
jgi:hypothetical protein